VHPQALLGGAPGRSHPHVSATHIPNPRRSTGLPRRSARPVLGADRLPLMAVLDELLSSMESLKAFFYGVIEDGVCETARAGLVFSLGVRWNQRLD
jgi:hypothetical protein